MKPAKSWKIVILGVGLLLALGCQRLMNPEAAVQKAIQDHLAERSDLAMDKMVMEVEQVNVNGDTAQAEVVFRIAGDPQMRMAYHYDLHREGSSWKVDSGRPSGSETSHPQLGESPAGGSMSDESGAASPPSLPEGHPPISEMNPQGEEPPPSSQP